MKNTVLNNKPLVSIIMAEYNTNIELLTESIESILNQSYDNFEFIIIDDCGKNDLKKILKNYNDNRIKLFKNESNKGLVFSLNKAIKESKGKYIFRMDTDDYSYSNRLEKTIQFLENNPKYDIVGSRCDFYDGNIIWGESKEYGMITRKKMMNGCPMIHPTVAFKKSVLEDIGGYLNYNRCEDYATWIEAFSRGYNLYVLQEKYVRYHLSKEDYKKRSISKRKGYFKLLHTEYKKLKPGKFQIIKMYIKTFIAGILPYNTVYNHHKKVFRKDDYNE